MEKSARLRRAHGRANGISSKRTGICASEDLQHSVSFVERDTGMSMPSERNGVSSPSTNFLGSFWSCLRLSITDCTLLSASIADIVSLSLQKRPPQT